MKTKMLFDLGIMINQLLNYIPQLLNNLSHTTYNS